ncbi:MAG: hypothetical protein C5B55_13795 [Blastocatellia bacterium]|nr:MAG: hypothetical protein C5B55_13795 [Blastocatellia bacterium]
MKECSECFSCYDDSVNSCPVDGQETFHSLPGEVMLDGRYILERRLGEGGMGVVYKAHHKFLKTTRAIKIIRPELVGNDPSYSTRFQQEAMAAAAIGHPNIISVPDYGFLDGEIPFLVMEFVEGDSLQDLISNEGRFTPERALEFMRVIASAVGAAHSHGIVHRDLKPLNIMIRRKGSPQEQIRILDFGLAKIKSPDLFGSFVGAKTTGIIGSPYYMAPEQWSEKEPDKRIDIYSLGIILYQMLSAELPFKGSSILSVMRQHLMTPPPPLAVRGSGISKHLEQAVFHALEKDPILRTASTEEFVAELERGVLGAGAKGRPRTRARAKPRSTTGRLRDTTGAETTAKLPTPRMEEKDLARKTADQRPALVTHAEDLPDAQVIRAAATHETTSSGTELLREQTSYDDIKTLRQFQVNVSPVKVEAPAEAPDREDPGETIESPPSHKLDSGVTTEDPLRFALEEARRAADQSTFQSVKANEESPEVVHTIVMDQGTVNPLAERAPLEREPAPPALTRNFLVIGLLGVILFSIVGVVAFVYFWNRKNLTDTVASGGTIPSRVDMVFIKGGGFTMGSDTAGIEQKGAHFETVGSFYMDRTEVTNAEYAEFVKATGYPVPTDDSGAKEAYWKPWKGTDPPAGRERWPVTNVSVKDAEAFAQWLSNRDKLVYRLPSEAEWEFAARNGSNGTLFPWGNSWDDSRANLNGKPSPVDVGSFPTGATQTGLLDMVGNVWEWTSSKASFYDGSLPKYPTARVWRGGSFADKLGVSFYNATDRGWYRNEDYKVPSIGFRLVRSAQ